MTAGHHQAQFLFRILTFFSQGGVFEEPLLRKAFVKGVYFGISSRNRVVEEKNKMGQAVEVQLLTDALSRRHLEGSVGNTLALPTQDKR